MSKREKQLEDKLAQANDALMMAREALGADDGPFIDDAIRKLKGDLLDARRERDAARPVLEAARELRCAALRIPKHMTGGEWSDVVLPMSLAGDIVEAIRVYDLAHAAAGEEK